MLGVCVRMYVRGIQANSLGCYTCDEWICMLEYELVLRDRCYDVIDHLLFASSFSNMCVTEMQHEYNVKYEALRKCFKKAIDIKVADLEPMPDGSWIC